MQYFIKSDQVIYEATYLDYKVMVGKIEVRSVFDGEKMDHIL